MTLHYGKRNAGSLTAAAPGDTLHIPFATYNDSGASITDTGFSHNQVEIYKNGFGTARATDSGVWLGDSGVNYYVGGTRVAVNALSDSGLISGDVKGIYSVAIRLFNTTDDTGFYDPGSHYDVVVQDFKILGQTGHTKLVNFVIAHFEIEGARRDTVYIHAGNQGFPVVNVGQIDYDTGAANRHRLALDLLSATGGLQTGSFEAGAITAGVLAADAIGASELAADAVTEIATKVKAYWDSGTWQDTGLEESLLRVSNKLDTGVPASVRVAMDSGTINAGLTGAVGSVTGAVGSVTAAVTVGTINANVVTASALAADAATEIAARTKVMWDSGTWQDTGLEESILRGFAKLDTGVADPILNKLDSGVAGFLKLSDSGTIDTGTYGGGAPPGAVASVDTGLLSDAVWGKRTAGDSTRYISDSGLTSSLARLDTGVIDTGQISNSVWNSLRTDHTVAASFGKVLADTGHIKDVDTGLSLQIADMDTGLYARIDDMDTGVMSGITRALAKIDTGVPVTITGTVDANIVSVNSTTVQGTGDTGTNDPWRPA